LFEKGRMGLTAHEALPTMRGTPPLLVRGCEDFEKRKTGMEGSQVIKLTVFKSNNS
jgi:hypothetical protein